MIMQKYGYTGSTCVPMRKSRRGSLRRLGDGAASLVVDDHWCVEPANLRLRAVELFHSRLPFTVVDGFGGGARFPEIDAACAPVGSVGDPRGGFFVF